MREGAIKALACLSVSLLPWLRCDVPGAAFTTRAQALFVRVMGVIEHGALVQQVSYSEVGSRRVYSVQSGNRVIVPMRAPVRVAVALLALCVLALGAPRSELSPTRPLAAPCRHLSSPHPPRRRVS